MNISGMIRSAKSKVEGFKQAKAISTTNKLKDMKEKRIKLEGRAKIYELESKEKEKLQIAKDRIKKQGTVYKSVQKLKQLKTANNKRKESKPNNKKDYWGGNTGRNVFE